MVRCCAIKNCQITWSRNMKLSFHNFPVKNPDLLAEWLKAIPPELISTPTLHTYICGKHFLPECYLPHIHNSKKCLRKNAIPTLFDDSMIKSAEPSVEEAAIVSTSSTIVEKSLIPKKENFVRGREDDQSNTTIMDADDDSITTPMMESDTECGKKAPASNTWTPTSSKHLNLLNREIEFTKKVKVLQRRLCQREQRMKSMEQIIKTLKSRMLRDQEINFNFT